MDAASKFALSFPGSKCFKEPMWRVEQQTKDINNDSLCAVIVS